MLRRLELTTSSFLTCCDRLIYYFFFPVMLFWKIGGASFANGLDLKFIGGTLFTLGLMFVASTLLIRFGPISPFQAGTFSQSCYRFNTYIGMAVILNSLGTVGVQYFGVMIAFSIPIINVMAVSLLIWYSGDTVGSRERLRLTAKALLANPLILACLAGLIYARIVGAFPNFIHNSLSLISTASLPMALISIGGTLSFASVRGHAARATLAAAMKLFLLPLLGYLVFHLLGINGVPFRVGMIFFALPASTAIYVLSSQLNSDTELAAASIVISTILSFISLSWALLV